MSTRFNVIPVKIKCLVNFIFINRLNNTKIYSIIYMFNVYSKLKKKIFVFVLIIMS